MAKDIDGVAARTNVRKVISESHLAKLRPHQFKPGQSGNPGGYKAYKNQPLRRAATNDVNAIAPKEICLRLGVPEGSTWGAVIIRRHILQAAAGNVQSAAFIRDTVEGKPTQRVEVHDGSNKDERVLPVDMAHLNDEEVIRGRATALKLEGRIAPEVDVMTMAIKDLEQLIRNLDFVDSLAANSTVVDMEQKTGGTFTPIQESR